MVYRKGDLHKAEDVGSKDTVVRRKTTVHVEPRQLLNQRKFNQSADVNINSKKDYLQLVSSLDDLHPTDGRSRECGRVPWTYTHKHTRSCTHTYTKLNIF